MTGEPREAAAIREALNWVWAGREGTNSYVVGEPARTEALAALDALVAQRDIAKEQHANALNRTLEERTRVAALERERDDLIADMPEPWFEWRSKYERAEARVAALTEALRKVKEFASDPFASEIVALRACLLEANEALGLPGPEDSPLRQMAREVLKEMRSAAGKPRLPATETYDEAEIPERGTPWKLASRPPGFEPAAGEPEASTP